MADLGLQEAEVFGADGLKIHPDVAPEALRVLGVAGGLLSPVTSIH